MTVTCRMGTRLQPAEVMDEMTISYFSPPQQRNSPRLLTPAHPLSIDKSSTLATLRKTLFTQTTHRVRRIARRRLLCTHSTQRAHITPSTRRRIHPAANRIKVPMFTTQRTLLLHQPTTSSPVVHHRLPLLTMIQTLTTTTGAMKATWKKRKPSLRPRWA